MDATAAVLLQGAWYALEQCGILLRDAVVLYRTNAYPSAVALAMIGREELGKHRMLLDEWKNAESTGKLPSVGDIQAAFTDHVDKQKRALLSLTFIGEPGSVLDKAMRTRFKHKPGDAEYQESEKVLQTALESLAKRSPDLRHTARMRALYVDLQDSGLDWSRPSQITQEECKKLLNDAVNDYVGQRQQRFNPNFLREMGEQKIADALDKLRYRPRLPEPSWV